MWAFYSLVSLCVLVFVVDECRSNPPGYTEIDVTLSESMSEDKQTCTLDGTSYNRQQNTISIPQLQPCVFLRCTRRGVWVNRKKSGCHYNEECKSTGTVITVGCRKYKCKVYSKKRPSARRYHEMLKFLKKETVPGCEDGDECREVGYKKTVDDCTTYTCEVAGNPLERTVTPNCNTTPPPACDCKTEDGKHCFARKEKPDNGCSRAVCKDIGGGKFQFVGSCVTPKGVCVAEFKSYLDKTVCRNYNCIMGKLNLAVQCWRRMPGAVSGQCYPLTSPEVRLVETGGQLCKCRPNAATDREEYTCGAAPGPDI